MDGMYGWEWAQLDMTVGLWVRGVGRLVLGRRIKEAVMEGGVIEPPPPFQGRPMDDRN